MDTVIRNVGDIDVQDRLALEHLLGRPLRENQQLVIGIVDRHIEGAPSAERVGRDANGNALLPEWCNVYAGLSDEEIADLEKTILTRADFSRPSE